MVVDTSIFKPCMIVGVSGRSPLVDGFGDIERATVDGIKAVADTADATHIAVACDLQDGAGVVTVGMGEFGIERRTLDHYDDGKSDQKIVFVADHPAFADGNKRDFGNAYLRHCYQIHIGYGYLTLLKFWAEPLGIKVPDNPARPICSELPRNMLRTLNIPYPAAWDDRCPPAVWQNWDVLTYLKGYYKI